MDKGAVLIIDDEDTIRTTLSDVLLLEGYAVMSAENGEAGVELALRMPFDVVILDLKMPGMNGIEVLRRVFEGAPDIRVILITAYGSMDTAIEAIHYRVFEYLLKPVNPEQVIQMVERAIADKRANLLAASDKGLAQHGKVYYLSNQIVVDCNKRRISWGGELLQLSPSEARLLEIFFQRMDEVITHSELVFLIQGYNVSPDDAAKILRPIVSRLRQKLDSLPGAALKIKSVRGAGYMIETSVTFEETQG